MIEKTYPINSFPTQITPFSKKAPTSIHPQPNSPSYPQLLFFYLLELRYNLGNLLAKDCSPNQESSQNLIFCPSPIFHLMNLLNQFSSLCLPHIFLMCLRHIDSSFLSSPSKRLL
ncbi:hypothetical protein AAZX31_17G136900 [Glycine max]